MEELLERYPELKHCKDDIEKVIDIIEETYKLGGKILICGNGGSCADCEHIVGELMKGFMSSRPLTPEEYEILEAVGEGGKFMAENLQRCIPAISLPSQTAIQSAFCNDVKPELVYAQLMFGYGKKGDCAIGLSTSGNSKNVVYAMKAAKAIGLKTVALTGEEKSKLSEICNVTVRVPETETYKVQELHLPVYHYICAKVEKDLFD
ncbi:MAG: SIS domain-containing protein [Bacillota bacterium]|nr:SIS domain-containing protein [Bacillota bacterium]